MINSFLRKLLSENNKFIIFLINYINLRQLKIIQYNEGKW